MKAFTAFALITFALLSYGLYQALVAAPREAHQQGVDLPGQRPGFVPARFGHPPRGTMRR